MAMMTRRWAGGGLRILLLGGLTAAAFAKSPQPLPLKVVGTHLENKHRQRVHLHGVNAASMEWSSHGEGHILDSVNTAIRDWHVNLIRLPLSQDRWFGKAPEQTDGGQAYRALVR